MNRLNRSFSKLKRHYRSIEGGMTLLEMLVSILMLVVFTSSVAMVMEFTLLFLDDSESGEVVEGKSSNGVLIDHQEIQLVMDQLVNILSQPGISKDRLDGEEVGKAQIAFDSNEDDPQDVCPMSDPVMQWGLPIPPIILPPGYRLCLWTTTEVESSLPDLLANKIDAKPGVYLLQALPESLSAGTLPTRRLFCRPRPFC